MASTTVTFSEGAKGWPSFYSYIPDYMIGMNNYFYSFSGGNLYRHNTNQTRNNFYGVQYNSTLRGAFNAEPTTVKLFKTIEIEGDSAWGVTATTNLSTGSISSAFFEPKEGRFYAYIRSNDNTIDPQLRNVNGIGSVTTVDSSTPTATTLTYPAGFKFSSMISVGDLAYKNNAGALALLGEIKGVSNNIITIDTTITGGSAPVNGDFILSVKNSVAESYGVRGYYMEFELTNTLTTATELFSVGSSVFKSFP